MSTAYCKQQVSRHDPDRYLTSIFARPGHRPGLWALYAFNLEIAKTREVVSEPLLGQIRLQWWRDAIADLYSGTHTPHQVIDCLADAVQRYHLPQDQFQRLIDAREFDMEDRPSASLEELIAYATDSAAPLVRLAARITGHPDGKLDEAADSLGAAWALTGLTRAMPQQAARGRSMIPQSASAEDIAAMARAMLDAFEEKRRRSAARGGAAFLLAPLTTHYLKALAKTGYRPERLVPERGAAARFLRLWWVSRISRL